ncbi:MAG: hypothetical protein ACRDL4_14830 [Thermoleophilaceae bacterium]
MLSLLAMPNPFVYSHPLPPSELIDREEEIRRLVELAEGAHNSRLTAPRRFGWTGALESVYGEIKDELVITWDGLEDSEKRVLAALAAGAPLSSRQTLERFELARATARDARARLIQNGFLGNEDGQVEIIDPLLALWVAQDRQGLLGD